MAMPAFDPDAFPSTVEWADMYRAVEWQAIPSLLPSQVGPGESWKRPAVRWREHENDLAPQAVFQEWFAGRRCNVGMLTGRCSGNVGVVDLDLHKTPAAAAWWRGLLELHNSGMELETPTQITGGGGVQMMFRFHPGFTLPTCKTPIGVDIRGQGGFAVLPPSMHESGRPYEWAEGLAPWEIDVLDAPEWLEEAIDDLGRQYGAGTGGGASGTVKTDTPSHSKNAFGAIIDGREDYMTRLIWGVVVDWYRESPIGPPTGLILEEKIQEAFGVYERQTRSRILEPQTPNADLLEREGRGISLFQEKFAAAVALWFTKVKEHAAVPKEPEPEPPAAAEPLPPHDPETGEVFDEPAPSNVIKLVEFAPRPPPMSEFLDPWEEYPAPVFPLDVLPSRVAAFVRSVALSTGADVSAVAMTALTIAGGALDQTFRMRLKRSGDWLVPPRLWTMLVGESSAKKTPVIKQCAKPLQAIDLRGLEAYDRAMAAWKEEEKGDRGPEPDKPIYYILNSTTTEAAAQVLSGQDRGTLVWMDEMSSWIGSLDGYRGKGSEADKGFWATAYNGEPYRSHRIGRGHVRVNNLCVSMIGGITPATMKRYGELQENGLLQRFLPVMLKDPRPAQDINDTHSAVAWEGIIQRLTSLRPCVMSADAAAYEVFGRWHAESYEMQLDKGLNRAMRSFAGKLDGIIGSLALILHLLDGGDFAPVSAGAAERALKIVRDFLIPHASALYEIFGETNYWEDTRPIASLIVASDKMRFVPSDFTRNLHCMRGLPLPEVVKRLSPLVSGGWLVEDYGRNQTVRAWDVVPGLREALAERRVQQIEARARTLAFMTEMRRKAALTVSESQQ